MKSSIKWGAAAVAFSLITGTAAAQTYGYGQDSYGQSSSQSTYPQSSSQNSNGHYSYGQNGYGQNNPSDQSGSTSEQWGSQQTYSQPYGNPYPNSRYGNLFRGQTGSPGYGTQRSGQQSQGQSGSSQGQYGWNQEGRSWDQSSSGRQQGQFLDAQRLIGEDVDNPQGRTLGHVRDIVFNPQNGQIFIAVGIGGGQSALIPASSLRTSGSGANIQLSMNATREELESGPTVQNNQWRQALRNPSFAQRIYSHYSSHQTSGMGGMGSSSLSGHSSNSGSSWNEGSKGNPTTNWNPESHSNRSHWNQGDSNSDGNQSSSYSNEWDENSSGSNSTQGSSPER